MHFPMGKMDSLELNQEASIMLQDLPLDQQQALGLRGPSGPPSLMRTNSGLQSMQSIEHALGSVEHVRACRILHPGTDRGDGRCEPPITKQG